jgi:vacuolar-type H+-ATPase subunit C/Vma6
MTTSDASFPTIKNHPEWGFVCGRISVLEGRLKPKDFFLALSTQQHFDDILQHLQDTFLRDYLAPGAPWEDFSYLADHCFYDLALSVREESPSPAPADLFLSQGDYLNLKNALSGMDNFPFAPSEVSMEKIEAIADGDLADLPSVFREISMSGGAEIQEFDETIADVVVDGAYLRHLLALAEVQKSPLILACVHRRVLSYAVSAFWRALRQERPLKFYQQYFLPIGDYTSVLNEITGVSNIDIWPSIIGGEVGDFLTEALQAETDEQLSRFELLAVNHRLRLAQDGRMQTAGPERVFAFLTGLHSEMQNLKLVVTGRLNNIDPALLNERLRDVYG